MQFVQVPDTSLQQRFSFAASMAAQYSKSRHAVEETLTLWLEWWRDVLLAKEDCSQFVTNIDREAGLREYAQSYNLIDVRDFMETIRTASQQLDQNALQSTTRLSTAINGSLEQAMLYNDRQMMSEIIRTVVDKQTVEHIRILDATGTVHFSSIESDMGCDSITPTRHASRAM